MTKRKIYIFVFLILIALWGYGFARFLAEIESIPPADKTLKTDVIVVVTGGNFRVTTGLDLFAQGLAPTLFISGVHPSVGRGDIIKLWKEEKPLPDCCILLGHAATTTMGNALETKEWAFTQGFKSIRLVTSAYHMPRALLEFHRAMPKIKIIPHPVEEQDYKKGDSRYWYITMSEYNKNLLRRLSMMIIKDF